MAENVSSTWTVCWDEGFTYGPIPERSPTKGRKVQIAMFFFEIVSYLYFQYVFLLKLPKVRIASYSHLNTDNIHFCSQTYADVT